MSLESCESHDREGIGNLLQAVAARQITGIVIRDALQKHDLDEIGERVRGANAFEAYAHIDQMRKVGMSFAEVREPSMFLTYIDWGKQQENTLRALFKNDLYVTPLRLLDSCWPGGAEPASISGLTLPTAVVREQKSGWEGEVAHMDFPPQALLADPDNTSYTQIGIVLFLSVPPEGGALQIWEHQAYTSVEYVNMGDEESKILHENTLMVPTTTHRPVVGEMVVFRTCFPHSVSAIQSGYRVTLGCFGLLGNTNDPITVWT